MKVFSKKKFIEVEGEQEYERCKIWVDKIDGKEVIKHVIDCYIVYDVWCVNTNEESVSSKLLKIIDFYGVLPQLKHFKSEVWELNEAIFQYIAQKEACENIGCSRIHVDSCKKHIAEEIADCYVMLEQFRRYYKISSEEMLEIMKEKIDRQLTRIESENK